tara:strand:+ start:461 stop:658 length:198 start_codon:yes stop_codon:yes gene_type:complete
MEITMSKEKPNPKPRKCKNHCACAEKAKKKKVAQSGKGDTPRNISSQFRENYAKINWESEYIKKT